MKINPEWLAKKGLTTVYAVFEDEGLEPVDIPLILSLMVERHNRLVAVLAKAGIHPPKRENQSMN